MISTVSTLSSDWQQISIIGIISSHSLREEEDTEDPHPGKEKSEGKHLKLEQML